MHNVVGHSFSASPWHKSWLTFTSRRAFPLVIVIGASARLLPSLLQKEEHDVQAIHCQLQVFLSAEMRRRNNIYLFCIVSQNICSPLVGLRVVGFVVGLEVTKSIFTVVYHQFENLPFGQIPAVL